MVRPHDAGAQPLGEIRDNPRPSRFLHIRWMKLLFTCVNEIFVVAVIPRNSVTVSSLLSGAPGTVGLFSLKANTELDKIKKRSQSSLAFFTLDLRACPVNNCAVSTAVAQACSSLVRI